MSESTSTPAESFRIKEIKAGTLNCDSTGIEMINNKGSKHIDTKQDSKSNKTRNQDEDICLENLRITIHINQSNCICKLLNHIY